MEQRHEGQTGLIETDCRKEKESPGDVDEAYPLLAMYCNDTDSVQMEEGF